MTAKESGLGMRLRLWVNTSYRLVPSVYALQCLTGKVDNNNKKMRPQAVNSQSRAVPVAELAILTVSALLIGYNLATTSVPSDPAAVSVASPNRDNRGIQY